MAPSAQAKTLKARLRTLRKEGWQDLPVTQQQLARALGISPPLVSSWESLKDDVVPAQDRLHDYARFFATPRSIEGGKSHLLSVDDLTPSELDRHNELLEELMGLHAATQEVPIPSLHTAPVRAGPWHFEDGAPVTIICSQMPARLLAKVPNANPHSPDYVELSSYADLDALVELFGHIRAANPDSDVRFVLAEKTNRDHLSTHLVVLGGVDWNRITRELLDMLTVPVRQDYRATDETDDVAFEVIDGQEKLVFRPLLRTEDSGLRTLVEDVAHFYRGPNPLNQNRTVTLCNAMFARGVYGAVRTLTDARFRDRNARYIRSRFRIGDAFSILTRVKVFAGEVATPDWTSPGTVLHEWSGPAR